MLVKFVNNEAGWGYSNAVTVALVGNEARDQLGTNIKPLAIKYGYSEKTVRRIIRASQGELD